MYQNLLALHSVDASHQEVISVEDIYTITDSMVSLSMREEALRQSWFTGPTKHHVWFAMATTRKGFCYHAPERSMVLKIYAIIWSWLWHHLCAISDDPENHNKRWQGKDWVYPDEKVVDQFMEEHPWPSVAVARNTKCKDLVLALLNWEIIEALFKKIFNYI